MTEHGLLMCARSAQGLRACRKFQTRRLMTWWNTRVDGKRSRKLFGELDLDSTWVDRHDKRVFAAWRDRSDRFVELKPVYEPGHRLWVKETWNAWVFGCPSATVRMGGGLVALENSCASDIKHDRRPAVRVFYAATPNLARDCLFVDDRLPSLKEPTSGFRPSIHMPRWASRFTLPLVEVRPERLQAISEADAIAEGAASRGQYRDWWNELHGDRVRGWDTNPWVWVLRWEEVVTR